MNAEPALQRRLVDISELDARLVQAESARKNPPQAARVQELLALRQSLSQELAMRTGARDDLRTELARIESDVKVVEARRNRDNALLATVTNPKDATGLEHELASLAKRQSDLEDAELEIMEKLDVSDASVAEQEALVAQTNAEGAELSTQAKAAVADATELAASLQRDREALREGIPADLLASYDRLASRSGIGAGILRGSTCSGCQMVLSGTDLQVIRQTPADVVVNCPECSCILVRID